MSRARLTCIVLLAAFTLPGAAVAAAPSAPSGVYTRMFNEYSTSGAINTCQFTPAQLNSVLKSIDLYQQAYSSDFPNAIERALARRASGYCSGPAPGATLAPSAGGSTGGPVKLGPLTAATNAPLPAPILILAALAAAFVLLAAGAALIRARGWAPGWGSAARHSLGEAGYRLEGASQDAADRRRRRS
ncbi:MAG TPA: hypothetical protein VG410_08815 [Solirubrobacteraceae bacterium]|nr:hypothetical protein [Solirubrobacteraceae bacterium]